MYYLRKTNMICFDLFEIKQIYKRSQIKRIYKKTIEGGYTVEELERNNKQKMHKVADEIVMNGLKRKEDIEVFVAIDFCFTYYNHQDTTLCFVLKSGVQPKSLKIRNVDDLKKIIEEKTSTDFAVFFCGLRQFQLKQYKNQPLKTKPFIEFLKLKLSEYGNELNDVNLLILLQGEKDKHFKEENCIDFREVYESIKIFGLQSKIEILIMFNEDNKYLIINQVYPDLKSMKKELSMEDSGWN